MTALGDLASRSWNKFWDPSVWLPPNVTWNDLTDKDGIVYPKFVDICYPVVYSFVVVFIRFIVEKYIFLPLGLRSGLRPPKKVTVENNPVLEKAFLSNSKGNLSRKQLTGLAKQVDLSEQRVKEWMVQRKKKYSQSTLVKLTESGWKLTYYSFAVCYGLWALWDKPWFWDITECWSNYPHQTLTWDIKFYYVFQLSCYWSLLFSQFVDVKRKDFLEMFVHHLITILLIVFSYTCNLIRGGSLVLIVHDGADVFMEAAKIFKYIRHQRACDVCFGLFFLVWTATRLVVLPGYLIKNFWFGPEKYFTLFPAFNGLKYLLVGLFFLHIMWTYFILKILYRALLAGKTEKDSRSSSSECSDGCDTDAR